MIARRTLLAGAPLLLLAGKARAAGIGGVPRSGSLLFDAFRNDSKIGTHRMQFAPVHDAVTVHIDVQFAVGLGPIAFYRYRMQAVETWQAGQFVSIDVQTNDNGARRTLSARRGADRVRLVGAQGGDRDMPADALPLTHWSILQMGAPAFNPDTGADIGHFVPAGQSGVKLADGKKLVAEAFHCAKPDAMTDWFDSETVWAGLRAAIKDGSMVEYRRLSS